jgi:MFS family permease
VDLIAKIIPERHRVALPDHSSSDDPKERRGLLGFFVTALLVGDILGNLFAGYIGDHHDGKIPIVMASIILAAVYIGAAVSLASR